MRVAVVHDWLVVSGGAEKVTRELQDMYKADVFALVDYLNDEDRAFILGGKHARTSFIQLLPFARKHFRMYLPLFPAAMERLDLRGYDLIISASYAVAKCVRKGPGQQHLCYLHTPMRYAWVNEEGYLRDHRLRGLKAWSVRKVMHYLRRKDTGQQRWGGSLRGEQQERGRSREPVLRARGGCAGSSCGHEQVRSVRRTARRLRRGVAAGAVQTCGSYRGSLQEPAGPETDRGGGRAGTDALKVHGSGECALHGACSGR